MTEAILEQALTFIINNPAEWDQSAWFCGTAACLAGHICLLAGAEPVYRYGQDADSTAQVLYHGQVCYVPELAEHLAGLTRWEGGWLWNAERTLPELYEGVNRITRDLALAGWMPRGMPSYGVQYVDADDVLRLAVHRRTTALHVAGSWEKRDHPTRGLAQQWAAERAHHLRLKRHITQQSKEDHT